MASTGSVDLLAEPFVSPVENEQVTRGHNIVATKPLKRVQLRRDFPFWQILMYNFVCIPSWRMLATTSAKATKYIWSKDVRPGSWTRAKCSVNNFTCLAPKTHIGTSADVRPWSERKVTMQKLRNRLEEICGLRRMDERMERDNKTSPGLVGRSEKKSGFFTAQSSWMGWWRDGRTDIAPYWLACPRLQARYNSQVANGMYQNRPSSLSSSSLSSLSIPKSSRSSFKAEEEKSEE